MAMPIAIKSIYEDVALDDVNSAENGQLNFAMFNRLSRRAENRMLEFLSGDINNEKAPMPYLSQKNKDWLSLFVKKHPVQVTNGIIEKPSDYYGFENMYLMGDYNIPKECESDEEEIDIGECNIPIELLDGSKYNERCRTYIEGLQPSFAKPIAKLVGNNFEFNPSDLGSITLEYLAYPVYGKIVTKEDTVFHDEVIDEDLSINYQYDEFARELLVFFISDLYNTHTREDALKQHLQATGKLVREVSR